MKVAFIGKQNCFKYQLQQVTYGNNDRGVLQHLYNYCE